MACRSLWQAAPAPDTSAQNDPKCSFIPKNNLPLHNLKYEYKVCLLFNETLQICIP